MVDLSFRRAVFGLHGPRVGPDDVGQMQNQRRACSVGVLEHGLSQAQRSLCVVSWGPDNTRCDGEKQEERWVLG